MPIDKSIQDEFDGLDDALADSKPRSSGDPPVGTYDCKIIEAILKKSQDDKPGIKYTLKIISNECHGEKFMKWAGLDGQQLDYAMGELVKLGHDKPKSKQELVEVLEQLSGTFVQVRVSLSAKGFCNKSFQRVLHDVDVPDDDESEEKPAKKKSKKPVEDDDDDTPVTKSKKKLAPVDDDDADEDEDDEKPKGKLVLAFDDDDIGDLIKPKIVKLAASMGGLDVAEDECAAGLKAMAMQLGLKGEFATAKMAYNAILAAYNADDE